MVYVVMAHTKHRPEGHVLSQERDVRVRGYTGRRHNRTALIRMYTDRLDETQWLYDVQLQSIDMYYIQNAFS